MELGRFRVAAMATVGAARDHKLSTGFVFAILLGFAFANGAELPRWVNPCQFHQGTFSAGLSPAFDIDRYECKIKGSPTILIWSVKPYVGVKW
jgi:hypothetical protein